jgi:CAAX prenyl protease-like protein
LLTALQVSRVGYDPFSSDGSAVARGTFIAVRLTEMVLIVPVMEELFWRGFLARYLIDDDFENVPQGVFTRYSFVLVTLAFASVHPEILAAITWGAMINLLYQRTANLWACVVMHAITNGLLGAYILATGNWHLW